MTAYRVFIAVHCSGFVDCARKVARVLIVGLATRVCSKFID
jgi:hypothetical protein